MIKEEVEEGSLVSDCPVCVIRHNRAVALTLSQPGHFFTGLKGHVHENLYYFIRKTISSKIPNSLPERTLIYIFSTTVFNLVVLLEIPDERIEGIRQMLDVFRGGILADWCVRFLFPALFSLSEGRPSSVADTFPLDVQECEENFDLALIASLEIDVVPYIGDHRIPDILVSQLGRILHAGSQACDVEGGSSPIRLNGSSSSTFSNSASSPIGHAPKIIPVDIDERYSDLGKPALRERFSYWCFDLLFLICSDTTKGQLQSPFLIHTKKSLIE